MGKINKLFSVLVVLLVHCSFTLTNCSEIYHNENACTVKCWGIRIPQSIWNNKMFESCKLLMEKLSNNSWVKFSEFSKEKEKKLIDKYCIVNFDSKENAEEANKLIENSMKEQPKLWEGYSLAGWTGIRVRVPKEYYEAVLPIFKQLKQYIVKTNLNNKDKNENKNMILNFENPEAMNNIYDLLADRLESLKYV